MTPVTSIPWTADDVYDAMLDFDPVPKEFNDPTYMAYEGKRFLGVGRWVTVYAYYFHTPEHHMRSVVYLSGRPDFECKDPVEAIQYAIALYRKESAT